MAHTDEYDMRVASKRILIVGRAVDCEEVVRRTGLLASQFSLANRVEKLMGVRPEVVIVVPGGCDDLHLLNEARHLAQRHGAQLLLWTSGAQLLSWTS